MTNIEHSADSLGGMRRDQRFDADIMYDATIEDDEDGGGRSPLFIVLTVLVLLAFVAVVWVAYQQGLRQSANGAPPIIAAEAGPIRIAPAEPGGVEVPDQDKMIYERATAESPAETLAAPPEEPKELAVPPAAVAPAAAFAEPAPAPTAEPVDEGLSTMTIEEDPGLAVETPPPPPAAAEVKAQLAQIDPGVAEAVASEVSPTAGAALVQVAAYRNDAEAAGAWQTLKSRNADLVQGLKPDIQRADLGAKGVWYRLRVGPFESKAAAAEMCQALKSRGGDCRVVTP